jgi:hypothetical protein
MELSKSLAKSAAAPYSEIINSSNAISTRMMRTSAERCSKYEVVNVLRTVTKTATWNAAVGSSVAVSIYRDLTGATRRIELAAC